MATFALYNYQFEKIQEPSNVLKLEFPNVVNIDPDKSFENKQQLFGALLGKDGDQTLSVAFWKGSKEYIHERQDTLLEDVVMFKLSNKKKGHRVNEKLKKEGYDTYPFIKIIIDNRPGIQRIFIEQNTSVFKNSKTPASLIQSVFNKELKKHLLKVELYSQYPETEFWKEVSNHPEGFRKITFHLPPLNLERLSKVAHKLLAEARQDWDSGLDFSFVASKNSVLKLDEKNVRQASLTKAMALNGHSNSSSRGSIEMYTAGPERKRILIGKDTNLTINISDGIVDITEQTDENPNLFSDNASPTNCLLKTLDNIDA